MFNSVIRVERRAQHVVETRASQSKHSARGLLLILTFALILSTTAQNPASALQIDVPFEQALVLEGGESTNPRSFDPATTLSG